MQRILFIISAFLIVNSSTELHELFRLPQLIRHYHQHQKEKPSLSLIDFLKIHYTGNHPVDNDDKDDAELPFKSPAKINHTDNLVIIKRYVPDSPFTFITNKLTSYYSQNIPDQGSGSVFHPPRLS